MKLCRTCSQTKPFEAFAKRTDRPSGHQSRCRECQHLNYISNREAVLIRQKAYREGNFDAIKARAAEYYLENTKAITERVRQYRESPAGRENCRRVAEKRRLAEPEKVKARSAVMMAIRDGTLVPKSCEVCGTMKHIQAHHSSYLPENHLRVNWLCAKHHKQLHINTP